MAQARPLPWPFVFRVVAGALPPIVVAALVDPSLVVAVSGGLGIGLGGTIMGRSGRAGVALALACLGLFLATAGLDVRLIALALAALAGWEAARRGGRAFTYAIFGVTVGAMALGYGTGPVAAVATLAVSGLWGIGVALWLRADGIAAPPREGEGAGWRLGIFLAIGLLLSLWLVSDVDHPRAVWPILLFVMRALSPVDAVPHRTLVYLSGAVLGVLGALLVEVVGPPSVGVGIALAAAAGLIGLRNAPLLTPIPGAAFTFAVLVFAAPDPAWAIIRLEAVLFSSLLAVALAEGLRLMFVPTRP